MSDALFNSEDGMADPMNCIITDDATQDMSFGKEEWV